MLCFSGSNEGSLTKRVAYDNWQSKGISPPFIKTFGTRPTLDYEVGVWANDEEESISRLDLKCKGDGFQSLGDSAINVANVSHSLGVRRSQYRIIPPELNEEESINTEIKTTEMPTPSFKMMRYMNLPQCLPEVCLETAETQQRRKYSRLLSLDWALQQWTEDEGTRTLSRLGTSPSLSNRYGKSIRRSRPYTVDEDGKPLREDNPKLLRSQSTRIAKPTAVTVFDTDTCTLTSTFCNSTLSDVYDMFDDLPSSYNSSHSSSPANDKLSEHGVDEAYFQDNKALYEIMHSVPHLHFDKLSVEKQAKLMRQLKPERYMKNEYIFKKGDLSCSFYFICGPQPGVLDNELAGVSVVVDDMGEKITCHLHVGSYFGERALICSNETTRNETVKVISTFMDVVRVGRRILKTGRNFACTQSSKIFVGFLAYLRRCYMHCRVV